MSGITLGQSQAYENQYNPKLLQPIARAPSRAALAYSGFNGEDVWTGYELSWLDEQGKPQVAIAEFTVPSQSPNIIESKSFKYYLNAFNQTPFVDLDAVKSCLVKDLSECAGAPVGVVLYSLEAFYAYRAKAVTQLGVCVDQLPVACSEYSPSATRLIKAASPQAGAESVLVSHLLKSNCPVTGQPDWASIWVGMTGAACKEESFLSYVVSFRGHQDFHEQCVERIFSDIQTQIQPSALWVYARYTRRGGLDINPYRASGQQPRPVLFGVRQ